MNYINVLDVVDPGRFPKTAPDSDITLYIVIGAFLLVLIVFQRYDFLFNLKQLCLSLFDIACKIN